MNNKKKETIVKISIALSGILGISWGIIDLFGLNKKIDLVLFISFLVSTIIMVILMSFIKIRPESINAEKYNLKFDSYNETLNFLTNNLNANEYTRQMKSSICGDIEINIFIKKLKLWEIDCFTIMYINELSEEIMVALNDKITDMLKEYYAEKNITDTINMISVFCVNRITPTFQRIVNSNMIQGFKNGRLVVGISFGGKKIYVARQKDGFAILKYKKMRKEFLKIISLNESERLD